MGEEGDWMGTLFYFSHTGDRLAMEDPTDFGISHGKYGIVNVFNPKFGQCNVSSMFVSNSSE